jgi:hypothetical protein
MITITRDVDMLDVAASMKQTTRAAAKERPNVWRRSIPIVVHIIITITNTNSTRTRKKKTKVWGGQHPC